MLPEQDSAYILVTGATSVVGRSVALRLARTRRVILSGRRLNALEDVRLATANPSDHLVWEADLSDPSIIESGLRQWMQVSNTRISGFVHCAGVFRPCAFRVQSLARSVESMNVNFFAAAEICRVLCDRSANGHALRHVVFITSVASRRGVRGYAFYSAAKSALSSFMRTAAMELAPRVRVNAVAPGAVSSPGLAPDAREAAELNHPLGIGSPEDVAGAVDFLLSEGGSWITGQELIIDGGWHARG